MNAANLKIGKMKEQVEMEHQARRHFVRRCGDLGDAALNKFYKPEEIDAQLRKQCKLQDLCPYKHTAQGDGHFVSPQMYEQLLATCRCGRPRSHAHMLRCVQRVVEPHAHTRSAMSDEERSATLKLPPTSNAQFGWLQHRPNYQKWEYSMRYISPIHTMPGHRIAATPYNAIFIG